MSSTKFDPAKGAALLVDFQKDFTEAYHGSLAVSGTDKQYCDMVIQFAASISKHLPIYATQDWHPENHTSFASNHPGSKLFETLKLPDGRPQIMWPDHCVQNTTGSEIIFPSAAIRKICQKGHRAAYDSYSGFFDDGQQDTGLNRMLKSEGIADIIIFGLATDFCVKATALDALQCGFNIWLIDSMCRSVNPQDTEHVIEEIKNAGGQIASQDECMTMVKTHKN